MIRIPPAAWLVMVLGAGTAGAQPHAHSPHLPQLAQPLQPAVLPQQPASRPQPFRSAFEGFTHFDDVEISPWRETNDTVRAIGGWRAYAREVQGTPTQPARGAASAAPRSDSAHRH